MLHRKYSWIFWVFMIMWISSSVIAVPPVTTLASNDALTIKVPAHQYFSAGDFYEFEVHVYNSTTYITSGLSCYFHFYNASGKHVLELFDGSASHNFDYSFEVDGANFTLGELSYNIQCNTTGQVGFTNQGIFVNNSGEEPTIAKAILYIGMLSFLMVMFILFISGIFRTENVAGKWAYYFATHLIYIAGTFSAWHVSWSFLTSVTFITSMFRIMFWFGIITLFPMIIIALFFTGYIIVMDGFITRLMEKGVSEGEAVERWKRKRGKK